MAFMSSGGEARLLEILPHRPPMVLLDAVVRREGEFMETEWTVPAAGPWIRAGVLDRAALVEVAAQTAAARAGEIRLERGLPPEPGYLGAIQDFAFTGDARSGERLLCTVETRFRIGTVTRVACVVRRAAHPGGPPLARGELSLAVGTVPPAAGAAP
jgi:predicted hotdog family 3-hydroxylacyl-ACP dehydratase